jgi:D-glycero-D-manno-heptose 1,7-bisphosphate phosphatase
MRTQSEYPHLVIIDRDGVLTKEIGRDVEKPDDLRLIPGAGEAIARLNGAGIRVALCSNQDVVGRGKIDMPQLLRIQERLDEHLAALGAKLDAVFYCTDNPDHPTPRHKPGCGMLEEAIALFGAAPRQTPVIGDQLSDLKAAATLGCPRHLVRTGEGAETEAKIDAKVAPVQVHDDLWAAVMSLTAPAKVETAR